MKRNLTLLLTCLALTLLCVRNAAASPAFSLWDAGYYLGALGTVLCMQSLLRRPT